jgi:predicted pyridoxine 5'-phosphate oxidase superfamily flavin-nucleotide-binding protein
MSNSTAAGGIPEGVGRADDRLCRLPRQYLSSGNLVGDDRISLILMDYANRRRLKIWGRAKLVDIAAAPALVARMHDPSYRARPQRTVVITIEAFDWNCPQHIPQR